MSIPKDEVSVFFRPKSLNEININQTYQKFRESASHSLNIAAIFAVNYVATVKGYDFEKIEKMILDKKLETYEKKFHPVYLKFIMKDNCHLADLILQRMNSNTDRLIIVNSVKIDSRTTSYFYIAAKDILNSDKSRILVFNNINNAMLKNIRLNMPEFGSSNDMQLHTYYVPDDLGVVVRHVQLYCLPKLGNYVSEMREKMASPLKRIFSKKGSISQISRQGSVKIHRNSSKSQKSPSTNSNKSQKSPSSNSKKSPTMNSLSFKSKSIESLLHANSNYLMVNFNVDQKSNSHTDLHKSLSTHSSLNDDMSNESSSPLFSKFEHLLRDERGLKFFKDFLKKEVSSENILFWEAVQDFKMVDNSESMKTVASRIFYAYMDAKSETPVNLECEMVEQARSLLNNPNIDMFNAASNHIFYLMKTDSYNRFRQSNYFELWFKEYKDSAGLKHSSSTSSLTHSKRRMQFLPTIFKNKKEKQRKDDSRKSSQTLDSDSSSSNLASTCKITMALDDPEIHCIPIQSNKKLIQILKKIDKRFQEYDAVVFDQSDNRIVQFSESMANLVGRNIFVEKSIIIRVGFVQINMDINLLEYVWFVIRPRHHFGLSHALDPVAKRVGIELGQCVVIKEEDPTSIGWDTPIDTFNKSCLFLLEQTIFRRAKFYGKSTNLTIDALWKKIISSDSFLSTLPFDDDNILDSRHDIFSKFKLEPRKVGYMMSGSVQPNDPLETTITRTQSFSYDDQRGLCNESQMVLPDFLKQLPRRDSMESSSLSSNRFSEIFYGDSDLSFSELDELSIPSPSNVEVVSDFD